MTNFVAFKRAALILVMVSMLVNCSMWNSWFGRDEVNLGEYVTLSAPEDVGDAQIRWVFSQLPDSSKLMGFLPSDTLSTVSFKPDWLGEYDVTLQITVNDEMDEESFLFEAIEAEDSSLVNREIPEHLIAFLEDQDTTVAEVPAASSYTDTGDERRYLSKVVSPDAKRSAPAKKRVKIAQSRPKTTSRGNLIPVATKTYTIQVSSWPSLEEAQVASHDLLENYGIESYIQRAFFKDKDEIYYRLRVGNFQTSEAAAKYAQEIQGMTNLPVWVDYVRQEM